MNAMTAAGGTTAAFPGLFRAGFRAPTRAQRGADAKTGNLGKMVMYAINHTVSTPIPRSTMGECGMTINEQLDRGRGLAKVSRV